ncbi:hypothetical protein Rhe02_74400 [Rhizocola hellebori]|uniref:YbaB/EbfC family DNA-binding protein n=1 Tax=Rhizocola hellebori TaxID=1392758 RepID=A0A8J3VKS9_9ACTN|nr:YbaB/EbfC family nucleoid-associated protein [Rhizocola hellebori]GIH09373.1 hypothetical protein Rhe02_74400 [Rhizocola hellebori]
MSGLNDAGRELADMLEAMRSQLGALQPQRDQLEARGEDPRTDGIGSDSEGLVKAKMGADGRLTELVLDDRTSVMPRAELQRAIIEAVNAAWAIGRGADPQDAAVANIDPEALQRNLMEMQDQAMRSMNQITDGLLDAMRQIHSSVKR